MKRVSLLAGVTGLLALCAAAAPPKKAVEWAKKDVKAGMVGCDTSHAVAFAKVLNSHPQWRVRVVAAFPQASEDMPGASVKRLPRFVKALREGQKVKIVSGMDELLKQVDAVMIESVDGRPHLRQARPAFEAGKLVFIDKPFTAGLADAREIVKLSKRTGVAFFSSSCVRFQPEIAKLAAEGRAGELTKCQASSPLHFERHHPDLFYYGIHGVEALYTVMGAGCLSVRHKVEKDVEWTTGTWPGGRTGVFRGVKRGEYRPLVKIWTAKGEAQSKGGYNYAGLCQAIARFFQTGKAPIDPAETLEIIEFMTAAQLSKERNGARVTLEEARKHAEARPGAAAKRE